MRTTLAFWISAETIGLFAAAMNAGYFIWLISQFKFTGFHCGIDNISLISVGLNVLIKRVSLAVRKIPYSKFPAPVYLVY